MSRRHYLIAGLIVLGVLLIVGLGRRYLERVPVKIWRGASAEVRRQPRLALERLLAAGGVTPRTVVLGQPETTLPTRGVLWIDEAGADATRAAVDHAWRWVEAGGTLVLAPADDPGPYSTRLGLRWSERATRGDRIFETRTSVLVGLPGHEARFAIVAPVGFLLPTPPRRAHGDAAGGLAVAEVPVGRGRAVIVANLSSIWTNGEIGREDHASFLWALARVDGPRAPLLFTTLPPVDVTLGQIVRRSWPLSAAGVALGLLALWRVLPRQGPVWQPPAPARRQLGEHLQAVGTYQVRTAQHHVLAAAAQRAVRDRLRRQPWVERPTDAPALSAVPTDGPTLLDTLQRLHDLWRRLHRA